MDASEENIRMTSDSQSKTCVQNQESGNGAALVLCSVSVACLSGLMMGYEMSLISGALLQLRDVLTLSCPQQEQVVGSVLFGAFLLSLGGGTILDRYGRRFSIILTALLCVLGTLLSMCVVSFWALVVGRMLVGMAVALSGIASCLYAAEVAPATWRGRCVCVYELMVVLGMLLGFGLSWAFAGVSDGWRFMFGGVLFPALLQAGIMPLLPQSPRFLLAQQREKEAHATLLRLRAGIKGVDAVEDELHAIRMALGAERLHGFLDLFRSRDNMLQRLLVGAALVFLQQATGQPNILAYASTVLSSVGFHGNEAATLASTGFGVVKVGGTIPAVFLVDKVGPKALLCVVVHVVLSAIFPTGIRGKAVSVISAFNWATNLLISMTFLTLTERIGLPSVIFSYAAMSFVLVVFVIVFVPETKGRSLEQISKELAMKNHLSSRLLCDRRKHEASAQPPQEEKALSTV
ncbi:hypothetical protein cypCar_00009300 [Cyprinus carpio]|nr:hypothetical protein cypCar_00009300 [Cyprinus carpio]